MLAIVGESGSGKTLTALAVMGLLPAGAMARGTIQLAGQQLVAGRNAAWDGLRGRVVAMVFQNPAAALNPVIRVGRQVSEIYQFHNKINSKEADRKTLRQFTTLGIVPSKRRFRQYPHQMSGGLQQRVMLAVAGALDPPLLIADEPTSALDLSTQQQILPLLTAGVRERGKGLLLITHDLGVVARIADRVLVMCGGMILEEATVGEIFSRPRHPHTQMLFESVPRLDRSLNRMLPSMQNSCRPVGGCPFLPRCRHRRVLCRQLPEPFFFSETHSVYCHSAAGRRHV